MTPSSSPVSPNFTSSKMLKCFTCAKLLNSSARLERAVQAATAELERGIAPAVFSSVGYTKFSKLPATFSRATSVSPTRKILATQAQIDSGVPSSESKPASCSTANILGGCQQIEWLTSN